MDGSAVKEIASLESKSFKTEVDGLQFSPLSLNPVIYEPSAPTLRLSTLQGIIDLVKDPIDSDLSDMSSLMIHVNNYREVILSGCIKGRKRQRDIFAIATLDSELNTFPFNKYLNGEEFQIGMRSQFIQSDDSYYILAYISKVSVGTNITIGDDGVSQTAEVKHGVRGNLKAEEVVKSILTLQPFRTFREVSQPDSEFLFRMRSRGDSAPEFGIWEADGGVWRLQAVKEIAEFLMESLPGIKVVV